MRFHHRKGLRIGITTPATFEYIGRISAKAAELEFIIAFAAKVGDTDKDFRVEELITNRQLLLQRSKAAFKVMKDDGAFPEISSVSSLFRKITKVLSKRDALVHGLIMHEGRNGLKSFHPLKNTWVYIDDLSLKEVLQELEEILDSMLELRTKAWVRLRPDALLQFSYDVPSIKAERTRLG